MYAKKFICLLVFVIWGWGQIFAFADTASKEEEIMQELEKEQWIKNHHGVIFYQDYSSDRYDLFKLASLAKELGTDIVKTWIKGYKPGEILKKALKHEYRNIFDSFKITFLNVCPEYILARWDQRKKYSLQTKKDIQSDFYQLTKFLIDNYDGQAKTFIINYFFEMNVYMGTASSGRPDFPVVEFISDAQSGVKKALGEATIRDIKILDCIEANCDHDNFHFVKDIFPQTQADLYSVSFYGTGSLKSHLDYWAKYAPKSALLKNKNIIVGEYGIKMEDPRVKFDKEAQSQYLESIREEARKWGVMYIFLFWLTDQESKVKSEGHFGLVDLKGRKTKAWEDLNSIYCPEKMK